jgi:hypothetical protein
MTSERRKEANRNNAKQSTGSRTAHGKLRAKRNARRHGLATKPAVSTQIERMAKAICGKAANRLQYEEALNIAESQFVVQAVRAARVAAIKRMTAVAATQKEQIVEFCEPPEGEAQTASEEQSSPEIEDDVSAFEHALPEMIRYDRYERRALSRRKRAIRNFVATSILGVRPTLRKR